LSSQDDRPLPGLRERKKARTRAAIQQHALRLFREQGYEATTVEQIAEAAEVSPSTFFRYFPTKEDVVLWDDLDPLLIAAFEAQPSELTPIQALRGAFHQVFDGLSAELIERQWERSRLVMTVPELRMRMLDQFTGIIEVIAELVARRIGRPAGDLAVRTFAGAVIGALLATFFAIGAEPDEKTLDQMDKCLALVEAGLPL